MNRKITTQQKLAIGATTAVAIGAVGAVLFHRGKVNELVAMHQEAVEWTMGNSFNEGVKHGLKLAQEVGIGVVKEAPQYSFAAFDRPA